MSLSDGLILGQDSDTGRTAVAVNTSRYRLDNIPDGIVVTDIRTRETRAVIPGQILGQPRPAFWCWCGTHMIYA